MLIKNKGTQLKIDSDKDSPDFTIKTNLFVKSIWYRITLAYSTLFNNVEITSVCNFNNNKEIEYAVEVLKGMIDVPTFNIVKSLPEAILPTKAHASDVGYDLYSPIEFRLNPGETRRIDFGIIIDIDPGYEIQVRNRSGIVWKYNTMMAIGTGTIDESYRGHIMAPFFNFGREQMQFSRGDRLAQLVIKKTEGVMLKEGKVNLDTERKDNGFGSSGK